MTEATLDAPVKAPAFHQISASRKIKNRVAESLFALSFLIAMVPLVWVLYTVIERGFNADQATEPRLKEEETGFKQN